MQGGGLYYLKDFWEFDPIANTWTQKADLGGSTRASATGFSIGNKGYIGLGFNDNGITYNDFWEYDPSNDAWTQKANFEGSERYDATGFSIGDKGYLGGTGKKPLGIYVTDFWEYTPGGATIATSPLSSNYLQPSDALTIDYNITGTFNIGNVFTAQLYDAGSTSYNPVNIGSVNGTTAGSINATIPFSTLCKNSYRIRVIGSSPNVYGTDNGQNISIGTCIQTGTVLGSPFCPETIFDVPFTSVGAFTIDNVYTAELSDRNGIFATPLAIGTLNSNANSGTITASIPVDPRAGLKYRIRVTSNSPSVTGSDNGINLELISCKKVTGVVASDITSSSALINWTGVSCATQYKVQYRVLGATKWKTRFSVTNSYTITGLNPNTTYEYRLQTFCTVSGSTKSVFTSIQTFATNLRLGQVSIEEQEPINVYPNPFTVYSVISFSVQDQSEVQITLYDLSGAKIETLLDEIVEEGRHEVQLNRKKLSTGSYFLQIKMNSQCIVKKVVIE